LVCQPLASILTLHPPCHALNEVPDDFDGNIFPLSHHSVSESIVVSKALVLLSDDAIDNVPEVFSIEEKSDL